MENICKKCGSQSEITILVRTDMMDVYEVLPNVKLDYQPKEYWCIDCILDTRRQQNEYMKSVSQD